MGSYKHLSGEYTLSNEFRHRIVWFLSPLWHARIAIGGESEWKQAEVQFFSLLLYFPVFCIWFCNPTPFTFQFSPFAPHFQNTVNFTLESCMLANWGIYCRPVAMWYVNRLSTTKEVWRKRCSVKDNQFSSQTLSHAHTINARVLVGASRAKNYRRKVRLKWWGMRKGKVIPERTLFMASGKECVSQQNAMCGLYPTPFLPAPRVFRKLLV